MRYRLVYTGRAERDIQEPNPKIKERLGNALLRYEEDPLRHAERLTHSKSDSPNVDSESHWGLRTAVTKEVRYSTPSTTHHWGSFLEYVEYLASHGFVPPPGKGWVDHIRMKGNEASHEIAVMHQADAEELLTFAERLLKFIYEFPSRVPKTP